jgi:hypothetical protein
MGIKAIRDYKILVAEGARIDREGMSERAIDAVNDWVASGSTYKGAMFLAGRLKAIATIASADDYWKEQVDKGFHVELAKAREASRVKP